MISSFCFKAKSPLAMILWASLAALSAWMNSSLFLRQSDFFGCCCCKKNVEYILFCLFVPRATHHQLHLVGVSHTTTVCVEMVGPFFPTLPFLPPKISCHLSLFSLSSLFNPTSEERETPSSEAKSGGGWGWNWDAAKKVRAHYIGATHFLLKLFQSKKILALQSLRTTKTAFLEIYLNSTVSCSTT